MALLKGAPPRRRSGVGRFVFHLALASTGVFGVIVALVSCAGRPAPDETSVSASSPLTLTGLFATGVDATGKALAPGVADPHYVLTSDDATRPGPAALVVSPVSGSIGGTATSNWVSAQANAVGANLGNYTFTTTFTLTGVDPTTAAITGAWACDDSCVLRLNGTIVASVGAPAWNVSAPFTVPAGSPFVTGTNKLEFVATNSGGGATGLQVLSMSLTAAGCTADNQCTTAQFCNTQTGNCVGTLPSGTPIPTITGHTPALTGVCAVDVGEAVCDAGVCDMSNNECGLANGDGPCTAANGFTVCQSAACSVDGTCEPSGGCNADGDCTGGKSCDLRTHTCVAPPDAGEGGGPGEGGSDAADGSVGSDGSEAEEASAGPDGSEEASADASGGDDGSALADATSDAADGAESADATEPDAADAAADSGDSAAADAAGDSAAAQNEGGPAVRKDLEGGGLSCSASRPAPGESSRGPLSLLALTVAAAVERARRRCGTGRRATGGGR